MGQSVGLSTAPTARARRVTIDLTVLGELSTLTGTERTHGLIALFLEETRARLDLLAVARANDNLDLAVIVFHRLTGAGGALGVQEFIDIAARIQRELRSTGMAVLDSGIDELECEFEFVRARLNLHTRTATGRVR